MTEQIYRETLVYVTNIENSTFTKDTIKHILLNIREFLPTNYTNLRDMCDLTTHTIRNKGLVCEKLKYFELSVKFNMEFRDQGKKPLYTRMPYYVLQYLKFQLTKCDENILTQHFKISIKNISDKINELLKKHRQDKYVCIPCQYYPIVDYLLALWYNEPVFQQENLINELVDFLDYAKFISNKQTILQQQNKIIMCMLIMLNDTKYEYTSMFELQSCYCYIQSMPNIVDNKFHLNVNFFIQYKKFYNTENLTITTPIMQTSLESSEWCDNNLAFIAINGPYKYVEYKTKQPLKLNNQFKICAYSAV